MQSNLEEFVKDELPQHLQTFQETTAETLNEIQSQEALVQELLEKFETLMEEVEADAKLPDVQAFNTRISTLEKRVDKIFVSSKAQLTKSEEIKQELQQEIEKSRQVVEKDVEHINQVFGNVFF